MRFSTSSGLLALAAATATAADAPPFEQYKAKFQNFVDNFVENLGAKMPAIVQKPLKAATEIVDEAATAAINPKTIATLTLENWNETLYAPVAEGVTTPEEWWVLISGGNKSCLGRCLQVETAFNETAIKFASLAKSPHLAYVNCDDQSILCYSWSAPTPALWVFEMLPPPAYIDIYARRLNLTNTTSASLVDLYKLENKSEAFRLLDSYFHPTDGLLAKTNMAIPVGYLFHYFSMIPSWVMMVGVSLISRTIMNRRMANPSAPRGPASSSASQTPAQ